MNKNLLLSKDFYSLDYRILCLSTFFLLHSQAFDI